MQRGVRDLITQGKLPETERARRRRWVLEHIGLLVDLNGLEDDVRDRLQS